MHNEDTLANYYSQGRQLGRLLYEGRWLDPQSLMMREAIQRWIASLVTGQVTLRLRRGEDYSIIDTRGDNFSYHPDKLSMERVEAPAFTPEDRIGALELQNLSVGDNREFLLHHLSSLRQLGAGGDPLPRLLGALDSPDE